MMTIETERPPEPGPDRLTYSVPEFCNKVGITRAWFYSLLKRNAAPDSFTEGKRRFIAKVDAEDWINARRPSRKGGADHEESRQ